MTLAVEYPFEAYACSSGVTTFPFSFTVLEESDISVSYIDTSGGVEILVKDTDYSVILNPDKSGNVELTVAYDDGNLEIRRAVPIDQQVNWINYDPFNMETHEMTQDKITMILQQFEVTINEGLQSSFWRGEWQSFTDYQIGELVTDPATDNILSCRTNHTSGSDFNTDLAAGYWVLILDISRILEAEANAIAAANAADASATAADQSAQDAAVSETNAAISEANAATSEDNAERYANEVAAVAGGDIIPCGVEMDWLSPNPPTGWFIEDGSQKSESEFSDLFAIIGYKFTPVGEQGTGLYRLPKVEGQFVRYVDKTGLVDIDGIARTRPDGTVGPNEGSDQPASMEAHTHVITEDLTGSHQHAIKQRDISSGVEPSFTFDATSTGEFLDPALHCALAGDHQHNTIAGTYGGSETRPVNTYRYKIIKWAPPGTEQPGVGVLSVEAGEGINVNAANPQRPIVSNIGIIDLFPGSNMITDKTDPRRPLFDAKAKVTTIVEGVGINIDPADENNPVVSNDGVLTVAGGAGINVDSSDPNNPIVSVETSGSGQVDEVVAGDGISVDSTTPSAPVVTNEGVRDLSPGAGITIDKTNPNIPVVLNDGVRAVAGGFNIAVDSTDKNNPIVATNAFITLQPVVAGSIPNNTFFLDNADGILKYMDATGAVQKFMFVAE